MKALILLASLFASTVNATVGPALIDEMNDRQAAEVEAKILRVVTKRLGVAPKKLRVDWNKARCLEVASEMDPNARMGVCTLGFSAFQVVGDVAMVKTADGHYEVKLIHLDIE